MPHSVSSSPAVSVHEGTETPESLGSLGDMLSEADQDERDGLGSSPRPPQSELSDPSEIANQQWQYLQNIARQVVNSKTDLDNWQANRPEESLDDSNLDLRTITYYNSCADFQIEADEDWTIKGDGCLFIPPVDRNGTGEEVFSSIHTYAKFISELNEVQPTQDQFAEQAVSRGASAIVTDLGFYRCLPIYLQDSVPAETEESVAEEEPEEPEEPEGNPVRGQSGE